MSGRRPHLPKVEPQPWVRDPLYIPSHENFPVVAVGASAGGLEACRKLLDALPTNNGMALLIVQHLDPTHESLLVDLLAAHTPMIVAAATDGMSIETEHVYVIPPGVYLSADDKGVLRLSRPRERHGARLPFDFLLVSLAKAFEARVVAVVMSGTGADGSGGLAEVKEKRGIVIAQDLAEAEYGGMPRSAIATGLVDLILPAAEIAETLVERAKTGGRSAPAARLASGANVHEILPEIVDLLRQKKVHDFRLYKPGTLERRVERRMALVAIESAGVYLERLRADQNELEQLSRDLLIHVTGFFRDAGVFEFLEKTTLPELVRDHASDRPLRVWVAGCSTGEETYSLAMLLREQLDIAGRDIKLQIFASDADSDAIAAAREGLYPTSIAADISPKRLSQFFVRDNESYRISAALRSYVVFTVQDVLSDPPFARLDFISCRNLLIYLLPEAQTKIISIFHFALREGGLLLVGNAENVDIADGRFVAISKSRRIYRRVGGHRPGDVAFLPYMTDGQRMRAQPGRPIMPTRQTALAELVRSRVVETYGPAAVLINAKSECLHFQGPTDRYLKVPSGRATLDLISKVRDGAGVKMKFAIESALRDNAVVVVPGGRTRDEDGGRQFRIVVEPLSYAGEALLLVCFVEAPRSEAVGPDASSGGDSPRIRELELDLKTTKKELQTAVRQLESSSEEQMAINEEAMSVNEEYQSTNEELLSSKEELQSLNEELTALNSQLQETLDRQRKTADDLQNVLYSTDVATIFLDAKFDIRFFTPATRKLFNVIPTDVGRPLTDLRSLASDADLLPDAQKVLGGQVLLEREIQTQSGFWFMRRIMPYLAHGDRTSGVVITFQDITERRRVADALAVAKRQAEIASIAKSRFLAAASHDLRQPLQTLSLLQGLLAKNVTGEKEQKLIVRIDEALGSMTIMLNTLLDINQIEVGAVKVAIVEFPVNDILFRLHEELTVQAQSIGLELRVVPCRLFVRSDPRLLEQMLRNLLSNAMKYTRKGRLLVGCRRRHGALIIEIWDTGLGIPESQLKAIFEEYYQVDNPARQRSKGLGLGLSIVKSLGELLGHPIRVRSLLGKGSVFSIEVPLASLKGARPEATPAVEANSEAARRTRNGAILIIEDDPEVRDHLEMYLKGEGFHATTAIDGPSALASLSGAAKPADLVLADYNLPNGMTGVDVSQRLRAAVGVKVPFIILTGDISIEALRDIALHDCVQFNKPVKLRELIQAIDKLLERPLAPYAPVAVESIVPASGKMKVFVVDDDDQVRAAISVVLEDSGMSVEAYASCEAFLAAFQSDKDACLLIDAYLPGMSGLDLLRKLRADGHDIPAIMITGNSDVGIAVEAMKAGATDFIEKPIGREELLAGLYRALELSRNSNKLQEWRETAANHLAGLTPRQMEVMQRVLAGEPSKNIAADLGISQRTVETHRARIMKRTGSKSLPALARLALIAGGGDAGP